MADQPRFMVVPLEWAAGPGFVDQEEALGVAAMKTRADRQHRAIVRVVATVTPDPTPAVVVTKFEDAIADDVEVSP
ncbi:MAG: hypothetical protein ACREPC_08015 [Stenotrophomonas sp.]|uniref:hypothetical protein n=1 Tax=Stenotrophomonas sp. TaxID=69392 RepID=UPI003D6CD9D0